MKLLFWGDTAGDTGPANVNKAITKHLPESFLYVNKKEPLIFSIWKCLQSDTVILSGLSRRGCVLAALAKRTVYIMHGCAAREAAADALKVKNALRQERYLLKKADLVLCVSKGFRDWVRGEYPQYAQKTDFLYPCAEYHSAAETKVRGSILAAGGDSAIKNNAPLVRAVQNLSGVKLEIYGHLRRETEKAPYCGPVSHEEFLKRLARAEIFALNSRFETFSLTVLEALCCGCSVLVTEAAGVTEVLALQETDVIHDPMDAGEIQEKLSYLLENPNNRRIMSALDWKKLSPGDCIAALEEKCRLLREGTK